MATKSPEGYKKIAVSDRSTPSDEDFASLSFDERNLFYRQCLINKDGCRYCRNVETLTEPANTQTVRHPQTFLPFHCPRTLAGVHPLIHNAFDGFV